MFKFAFAVVALLVFLPQVTQGDCGGIPFAPNVAVFEPNQRALIAFNGKEQILLLSADLRVSEPTKVLQVLPLPSEPKITEGDFDVFVKATDLINSKLPAMPAVPGMGGFGGGIAEQDRSLPAGEVTFHEKIGSHDLTVTHVLDQRGFVDWVENYLREAGVDNPVIPEPMKAVVSEYLRDRFVWFVFDVIDAGTEVKSKEAIQYRFATDKLYYPLRITRSEKGDTNIRLIVVSPELVELPRLRGRRSRVRLMHQPIRITSQELDSLGSEDLTSLIKTDHAMIRIWEITGPLSGFRNDVLTPMMPPPRADAEVLP